MPSEFCGSRLILTTAIAIEPTSPVFANDPVTHPPGAAQRCASFFGKGVSLNLGEAHSLSCLRGTTVEKGAGVSRTVRHKARHLCHRILINHARDRTSDDDRADKLSFLVLCSDRKTIPNHRLVMAMPGLY